MLHTWRHSTQRLLVDIIAVALGLSCLMLVAGSTAAQDQSLSVELAGFTSSEWPDAGAVVTVLGPDGRPVPGLGADSFAVEVDGAAVEVRSVDQSVDGSVGIAVVLAIDVSSSMAGAPLEQAKVAARTFLNGLDPNDNVAIITFADTVDAVLPFTTDRDAATGAIGALETRTGSTPDGTALYDATVASIRAPGAAEARRAIVLLSDGVDNASSATSLVAVREMEASRVPAFTISLGGSADLDPAYLRQLAEISGGRFSHIPTPEGLAEVYSSLAELLRGQYVLALDATGLADPESQAVTVRVNVTAGAQTGNAERVFAPEGPTIRLTGIGESGQLSEVTKVTAEVTAAEPVAAVVFLLDGQLLKTVTEAPYTVTIDPDDLGDKDHTLSVGVITASGQVAIDAPVSAGSASGGGGEMVLVGGAVVAVGAALALAVWLVLRQRGGGAGEPTPPLLKPYGGRALDADLPAPGGRLRRLLQDRPVASLEVDIGKPLGRLVIVGGPLTGTSYAVGDAAASIGAGHRCLIHISGDRDDGEEIAPEEGRVWVRGGQLMVHELRRLTAMGSVGGSWSILSSGEAFAIGENVFRFELDPDAAAALEEAPAETPAETPDGTVVPEQQPQPVPPVAEQPASGVTTPAPDQGIPNILRDRPAEALQPSPAPGMPTAPPGPANGDAPRLWPSWDDRKEGTNS